MNIATLLKVFGYVVQAAETGMNTYETWTRAQRIIDGMLREKREPTADEWLALTHDIREVGSRIDATH